MSKKLSILMVEDSESDAEMVARILERAGFKVRSERVDTAVQMRKALVSDHWDVVIADHSMPQFDAPSALKVLQQSGQDIPFIIVSGTIDEKHAVEIMRAGANDYLLKDNLLRLVPAVERELVDAQTRLERKLAEESLEESEALLKAQFINSPDLILILNREYRIRTINRVLVGQYSADSLVGCNGIDLLPLSEQKRVRQALDKCWASGEIEVIEHQIGDGKLVQARLVPLKTDGRVTNLMVISTDITEKRRLEDQLRQAHKMEAIGQLAGGIAHDFNNVLAAILLHIGLLQGTSKLAAPTRTALAELEKETLRAGDLTRQLLAFSRKQKIELRPVDIDEILGNLSKMLSRILGEHINVDFQSSLKLPHIKADPGMIEQVIMNLCVNARDAMPNGGALSVNTALVTIDEEAARWHCNSRAGQFVCLSVSDTGCGMDSATVNRIFEPFFTTKGPGKGTGLGLASVYGIVQQHQGWIEVDSSVGKGSTFRIFLPASDGPIGKASEQEDSEEARGGSERILLVEDEPLVRSLAAKMLQQYGYSVTEAGNGIQALDLWKRHEGQFDLLFTDMVMPGGITGLELSRRLKEENKALQVIISSGYGPDLGNSAFCDVPGVIFLHKPYTQKQLPATVRKCLDSCEVPAGEPSIRNDVLESPSVENSS